MMSSILAKRIETPSYGRELEIIVEPEDGELSRQAFAPHVESILVDIGKMLEVEFNDTSRFFLNEESGFPLRSEITGEFYLSSLTYSGDDEFHELWVLLYCLGKNGRQWGTSEANFDYVSMEMIVYLSNLTGAISFEEGFNSAAI